MRKDAIDAINIISHCGIRLLAEEADHQNISIGLLIQVSIICAICEAETGKLTASEKELAARSVTTALQLAQKLLCEADLNKLSSSVQLVSSVRKPN